MRCPIQSTSQSLSGYHCLKSAKILVHIIQESKYTPHQRLAFAWQRSTRFRIDHRPCKFDKYLDTQFVWCKMSGDNFLDKSSLIFLCSRHSHRYFQTTRFSTVKVPSSCSTFERKTDILYHSYTFILRWWLQLDFHLDLTDLTVRFSRPFSNSLHAASPTRSSFSPILTCLTTNFFFKRTPSAIFRKSRDIKELFDKMENADLVARVCICST